MPEFSYVLRPRTTPSVPLGGAMTQSRPLIPITVIGTLASLTTGLVDTGADETVFPMRVAVLAGIDLAGAITATGHGPDGSLIPITYVDVMLRMADSTEQREWPACVAFSAALTRHGLLGQAGFLQFFTATFRGDLETVNLDVNPTYPGT